MNVEITEFEKRFCFELCPVTQLCGQNVRKKNYIFESLRRYFGTFKYSESKNKWRDNVFIDNNQVGRKFFSVLSISNKIDIIQKAWSGAVFQGSATTVTFAPKSSITITLRYATFPPPTMAELQLQEVELERHL